MTAGNRLLVVADSTGVVVRRLQKDPPARRLAGIGLALEQLVAAESTATYGEASSLTAEEEALLDDMGLDEAPVRGDTASAIDLGIVEFATLLAESLTVEETAKRLGVNGSRIRQRLTSERSLFGIKSGKTWRVPLFQFDGRKEIEGLAKVFPALRPEVDPTSVFRWLTLPHPDLVVGASETPVSPIQWLRSGRSPAVVSDLATEL